MEFGSSLVYAAKDSEEFEYIPESRYNHVVTGFATASSADYKDDGEVRVAASCGTVCAAFTKLSTRISPRMKLDAHFICIA